MSEHTPKGSKKVEVKASLGINPEALAGYANTTRLMGTRSLEGIIDKPVGLRSGKEMPSLDPTENKELKTRLDTDPRVAAVGSRQEQDLGNAERAYQSAIAAAELRFSNAKASAEASASYAMEKTIEEIIKEYEGEQLSPDERHARLIEDAKKLLDQDPEHSHQYLRAGLGGLRRGEVVIRRYEPYKGLSKESRAVHSTGGERDDERVKGDLELFDAVLEILGGVSRNDIQAALETPHLKRTIEEYEGMLAEPGLAQEKKDKYRELLDGFKQKLAVFNERANPKEVEVVGVGKYGQGALIGNDTYRVLVEEGGTTDNESYSLLIQRTGGEPAVEVPVDLGAIHEGTVDTDSLLDRGILHKAIRHTEAILERAETNPSTVSGRSFNLNNSDFKLKLDKGGDDFIASLLEKTHAELPENIDITAIKDYIVQKLTEMDKSYGEVTFNSQYGDVVIAVNDRRRHGGSIEVSPMLKNVKQPSEQLV